MKIFLRKIFTKKPFENILVSLLSRFPDNYLFKGLRPGNNFYSSPAIRNCTRYGINFCLDISDYQNWLLYFYCKTDSSFGVLNCIKKGDVVLDIGGNIGQTAMMIANKTTETGKVFSFEPFPATYSKFVKNLSLNPSLEKIVSVKNCALGNAVASLSMYRGCDTNSGSNRITNAVENKSEELVEVPVSTADIFVNEKQIPRIDFIKIDVEGFEMNVLKGAEETLRKHMPGLFVELNDKSLKDQGSSALELITFLKNIGYKVFEDGKNVELALDDVYRHIDIVCLR